MASSEHSALFSSRSSRDGTYTPRSLSGGDVEVDAERDAVLLKLRTAVGNGNDLVDLSCNGLNDEHIRELSRMIAEQDSAARSRALAAEEARLKLEKAREQNEAPSFDALFLAGADDAEEQAVWAAGCQVVWPDDPIIANELHLADTVDPDEPPPSYRFTPRSQRADATIGGGRAGGAQRANVGRARVLFRKAIARHTLQQKALWSEVVSTSIAKEEAGSGCHHLNLQSNALTSRGAAPMGSLVRSSVTLQTLALGCNDIGDAGATLLGRALPHTHVLTTLGLQACARVTNSSLSPSPSLGPSPSPVAQPKPVPTTSEGADQRARTRHLAALGGRHVRSRQTGFVNLPNPDPGMRDHTKGDASPRDWCRAQRVAHVALALWQFGAR